MCLAQLPTTGKTQPGAVWCWNIVSTSTKTFMGNPQSDIIFYLIVERSINCVLSEQEHLNFLRGYRKITVSTMPHLNLREVPRITQALSGTPQWTSYLLCQSAVLSSDQIWGNSSCTTFWKTSGTSQYFALQAGLRPSPNPLSYANACTIIWRQLTRRINILPHHRIWKGKWV